MSIKSEAEAAGSSLAKALAARFLAEGGKNFITDVHVIKPHDGSPWFEVTVKTQPFDARPPEQLLEEAQARIRELEQLLACAEQRP